MLLSKESMNHSLISGLSGWQYSPTETYFPFDQSVEGSEVTFPYGFCSYYARSDEVHCLRQRD